MLFAEVNDGFMIKYVLMKKIGFLTENFKALRTLKIKQIVCLPDNRSFLR